MPELPEVEVILQELKLFLIGQKISYIEIRCTNLRWPISQEIYKLKNQLIINITRRSKYLVIKLFKNGYILIHLGMSGNFRFIEKKEILFFNKHDHIDFVFNNKILRYNDPRRFGFFLWFNSLKNNKFLNKLGPEPFSKAFNYQYLFKKSRFIKKSIKPWLMENKVIAGIGNIYANEILFESKIFPDRKVMSLTEQECLLLVYSIKKILLQAIKSGGTTIRNFIRTNGKIGFFNTKLKVYNKKGKQCSYCFSYIKTMKHNKRTTFFCSFCQK